MFAWEFGGFLFFELMIAGIILVSIPIIIHLLNRLRYRRIRWAAMEFLLKAQKRQRRRMIIEQLLLLALRCVLMALLGFWVAGYVGCGRSVFSTKETLHVVILDDSPSMGDGWKDKMGDTTNSFEQSKEVLREKIAKRILEASHSGSKEYVVVYRLSDLEEPVFADRLNDQTYDDLKKALTADEIKEPSFVNVPPLAGLEKARKVFSNDAPELFEKEGREAFYQKDVKSTSKAFHFVTDLRERDWKGNNAEELRTQVDSLNKVAKVYLVDVADPSRSESGKGTLRYHDNIGITGFQGEVPIAGEFEPVKFVLTINNYTNSKFEMVPLKVKVNGVERPEAPPFITLPPGPSEHRFKLGFEKEGYNHIQAILENPDALKTSGLVADNARFTTIEVQKTVRILMIDGDYPNPPKDKEGRGDPTRADDKTGTFYLEKILGTTKGYKVESGRLDDLERPTLFQYPSVYLLNIPELSPKAIQNLERFAREGGGVCFFLGEKVKPEEYNKHLFKDGKGLFPAPLNPRATEAKIDELEKFTRVFSKEPNLFVRNEKHPMFAPIYEEEDRERHVNNFFIFMNIEKYYGVDPLKYKKGEDADKVEELFTLPNRKSVDSYRERAFKLVERIPEADPIWKDYTIGLQMHKRNLSGDLIGGKFSQLFELVNALYKMLHDPGNPEGKIKQLPIYASLDPFWKDPRNAPLRQDFESFIEEIRFGDPFMVARPFGRGKVVACMSTASSGTYEAGSNRWNDWADGLAVPSYVVFMPALRKYLSGITESPNVDCGKDYLVELDQNQYENKLAVYSLQETRNDWKLEETLEGVKTDDGKYHFEVKRKERGIYILQSTPIKSEENPNPIPENKTLTANVDSTEGDLRRTPTESLEKKKEKEEKATLFILDRNAEYSDLSQKVQNYSESSLLYLAFLVILIVEQALAVHCSYHSSGTDLPATAQTSMHLGAGKSSQPSSGVPAGV